MVSEERHVVGGGLDAQDQSQLVIHLDGNPTHVVLDSGPFDAGVEVVADLPLVVAVEPAPQERRDMLGLDCVDGGSDERLVQGSQVVLALEDDVGGVFHLHETPVVARAEALNYGAEHPGEADQPVMKAVDSEGIGKFLRPAEILDVDEDVVREGEAATAFLQPAGQLVVAVEVELQSEGGPRGNPQVTQAQVLVDEVEVVVQALPVGGFEESLAGLLVVPGPEGRAGFHGGEDVHESGMVPALGDDRLDPLFLAEVLATDEVDVQASLAGQPLGVLSDFLAQGLGELGVIEQADVLGPQMGSHCGGMADLGNGASDDDAVVAGEQAANLVRVAFSQGGHGAIPPKWQAGYRRPLRGDGKPCLVPAMPG